MTKILAIDLAYSGDTGWCLWVNGQPKLVGTFNCKTSIPASIERDIGVLACLRDCLMSLVASIHPDYIAYEYTDWHRNLLIKGRPIRNFGVQYKIERQAQWSLGMSNAVILLTLNSLNFPIEKVLKIGANEAKHEFGVNAFSAESASLKEETAKYIAQEFPQRFSYYKHDTGYLRDNITDENLSDDISDAIMIARVADGRIRQNELAMV